MLVPKLTIYVKNSLSIDNIEKIFVQLKKTSRIDMAEKPEASSVELENVSSNFPQATDPDLDIKVAGIIKTLGIAQTPTEEFLTTMESELVASVDQDARIAIKADTESTITDNRLSNHVQDEEKKQQSLIEKKLKLYQTTQENIKKEISRLLAISGSANLSPENAQHIDRLITNMRTLDDRIAFYTKKDQMLHQKQQEREQKMLQINQKKKLAEKIKQQKKELGRMKVETEQKTMASFFLPGKWLDIYRKNQQSVIAKKEKDIAKSETQLKALEKKTQPAAKTTPPKLSPQPAAHEATTTRESLLQPKPVQQTQKAAESLRKMPADQSTRAQPSTTGANNQKPLYPQRAATPPHTSQQKPTMFSELFDNAVVKGTTRGPDTQPAKVMQAAEQSRNTVFTKQTADIRLQEQRTKKKS
ncbi:MAG: hypothetical protein KBC27_00425 [Rickettsiales bacterium]|nr:hypothetical protein [Rickettsiales bacterium]